MPGILAQPDMTGEATLVPVGPERSRPVRTSPVQSAALTIREVTAGRPSRSAAGPARATMTA